MTSIDGKVELQMLSFEAPKIRLLRSLSIETETMQVSVSDMLLYPCLLHQYEMSIKRGQFWVVC